MLNINSLNNGCKKMERIREMNRVIKVAEEISKRVAQMNPEISKNINDAIYEPTSDMNPKIETFARPRPSLNIKDEDGTVHSFAVEVKAKHNGPIPDTQLMSKILQAIESHSDSTKDFATGDTPDVNSFEVVSFKYERRDDKKKQ